MSITLQSTVGGFSPEFVRKLPALEKAMVAHGLEPSQFVISKDWATQAAVPFPFLKPFFYDYTVFIGEENFTVTEPNDIRFLDYFYNRCIAEDDAAPEQASEPVPRPRRPGLVPAASSAGWRGRFDIRHSPHCLASVASAQPSQ
jgi:hypothetical protein